MVASVRGSDSYVNPPLARLLNSIVRVGIASTVNNVHLFSVGDLSRIVHSEHCGILAVSGNSTIDAQNSFGGKVPMGWSVGKPFVASTGVAYFQLTKVGCPPAQARKCEDVVSYDEAWLFSSADIASAGGTNVPTFSTLPNGDVRTRAYHRVCAEM